MERIANVTNARELLRQLQALPEHMLDLPVEFISDDETMLVNIERIEAIDIMVDGNRECLIRLG